MTDQNTYWTTRVEVFQKLTLAELEEALNDYYHNRFIIATQVFPYDGKSYRYFDAIVYYKTPPEQQ